MLQIMYIDRCRTERCINASDIWGCSGKCDAGINKTNLQSSNNGTLQFPSMCLLIKKLGPGIGKRD